MNELKLLGLLLSLGYEYDAAVELVEEDAEKALLVITRLLNKVND